jgi:hypothetical protein
MMFDAAMQRYPSRSGCPDYVLTCRTFYCHIVKNKIDLIERRKYWISGIKKDPSLSNKYKDELEFIYEKV